MRTLYLDMTSGISGDIFLASLLSLGADNKKLSNIISKILNKKVELKLEKVYRNSVACSRLNIICDIEGEPFRNLEDIKKIINLAECDNSIKEKTIEIFHQIAKAESEVHDIDISKVHFHEIGAVDTIIDIFGVCWCLQELKIEKVVSNIPVTGYGFINTAHGIMPLPAPATIKLLENIPLKRLDVEGEMITPTGAALLKVLSSDFSNSYDGKIIKSSFSTGQKEFENLPNFMEAVILENDYNDSIVQITTNIDNMTGELFGYLYEKLMENGAKDVAFIPAFGKKNRPLYIVNIMANTCDKDKIIYILFKYSTTIGVRVENVNRVVADREFIEKDILGEKVRVKHIKYNDIERYYPEWEDIKKVAEKLGVSPINVIRQAVRDNL